MTKVRVRGIYSTALSHILHKRGFKIVEASEKIRERLGIGLDTSPCSVTVKDTDNPDEILVIGLPSDAVKVYDVLTESLKYVFQWRSNLELYGVYNGIVVDKQGESCIVDIGSDRGLLYPCREPINSKVIVGVNRTPVKPGDKLILTKNFRVVGNYLAILHNDPKITFSEHIRDHETRSRLSAIAMKKLMGTGIGIHFRSSSKHASVEEVEREIDSLLEEYKNIIDGASDLSEPCKLRDGEFVGIIGLTSLSKEILDGERRSVVYTIHRHHSLKTLGLSDFVDFIEGVISESSLSQSIDLGTGLMRYIAKKTAELGRVEILHCKPSGEVIKLGYGQLIKLEFNEEGVLMVIKREMKTTGLYDGLEVQKKPGDLDYIVIHSAKSFVTHNYYRNGSWLGSYVNINTPPELAPGVVKYHDLLIDVVIYPDGNVKIVDENELDEYCGKGYISETLCSHAFEVVKEVTNNPFRYVYNPRINQVSTGAGVPELGQRGRA